MLKFQKQKKNNNNKKNEELTLSFSATGAMSGETNFADILWYCDRFGENPLKCIVGVSALCELIYYVQSRKRN